MCLETENGGIDMANEKEKYIFVPVHGANAERCSKCCFYFDSKKCKDAKCTTGERQDGKEGYFRVKGRNKETYRIVDYPQGI